MSMYKHLCVPQISAAMQPCFLHLAKSSSTIHKKETVYVFPIYIIVLVVVVHKAVITFLSDDESMPWKDAWMLYSTHH